MSDAKISFSVVLPCRNQGDHVGEVMTRYFPHLDWTGYSYELVAVPNACTDDTLDRVQRMADKDSRI